MKINNLSEREQLVADLLWSAGSRDELELRMKSLPDEDKLRAVAITELMIMGGDEVKSVAEAQQLLSKFML
jgi:hypothetical protein